MDLYAINPETGKMELQYPPYFKKVEEVADPNKVYLAYYFSDITGHMHLYGVYHLKSKAFEEVVAYAKKEVLCGR